MGKGSAPGAPDPYQSAAAQYQFGTQAANYNMGLNAVNKVTPYGSTTWSVNPGGVSGSNQGAPASYQPPPIDVSGFTGQPPTASPQSAAVPTGGGPPQYTETQTLNPNEQQILTGREGLTLGSQQLAGQQGEGVGRTIAGYQMPTEGENGLFGGQAMRSAYGAETATMDPYWSQQQEQMDASLRNAGATPGTPAYDNAMREFQANRSNAYLQAENQAFGQGLSAQGQEIQDVNAAKGGEIGNFLSLLQESPGGASALGGGGGGGGPSSSVSAPNIMQAFENQYQGQLANYNADVSSSNADVGALATLAAAFIASDKRLKTDIEPIHAKTSRGNPLYEYRYKFQPKGTKQIGVMAQEAEKNTPEAVVKDNRGIRYVDYARA